ncbi:MAG TPA: division/cell wall cluster transcriptional repressor MraZ, partial [Burkholderiaceae bacterium]|nr:division/cell wall cluster transcriptional repressor MraZ [Burkholderiaceae bacterium]
VDRDNCLLLYPLPDWEEIERKLVKLPSFNKQARRLQRLLVGHATECELDGAGRILLPPPLREFAALNKDIVLIGQGNKFEIWDAQTWNVRRAEWLGQGGGDEGPLPSELENLSL